LDRRFERVLTVRRNPYVPPVNWREVFAVALFVGKSAVPVLLGVLGDIVRKQLAKGKKPKTVALYGPDNKVVKRLRKPPLR